MYLLPPLDHTIVAMPGRSFLLLLVVIATITVLPSRAHAVQTAPRQSVNLADRPVMNATSVDVAPVLDGDVIHDDFWAPIPPISAFWQKEPDDGDPATERTEVRVAYTQDILYVAAVLFDAQPQNIIVSDSRRDASLDNTDSFRFILDTYRDSQNGFVFGTNPAGIEYDAQVTNAGQGGMGMGRQTAGSGGGFNINWDGSWEVKTEIGDYGWSVEFAIPFRTLRFPQGEVQSWGINFQRTLRRRNENDFWARIPRQFDLNRVSLAGEIGGIRVPNPRNLKIMPYVLASRRQDFSVPDSDREQIRDFGIDLKYSITPSLTLDATYNTDFAQVEVDEQQVNLDRFSLFFPEKRPFFLENAGLFSVGETQEVELFFSRNIGLAPDGSSVPIVGGGRVSGNAGGLKLGLLEMQTESASDTTSSNNFAVARVVREFRNRSAIGLLVTNRQGTGDLATDSDYNRLIAIDGQLGIGEYGEITGFYARSETPGLTHNPTAFRLNGQYSQEVFTATAGFTQVAANFNPEVGFLQRSDYRKASMSLLTRIRPEDFLGLQELRPHVNYRGFWGLDGFQDTGYLHIDNHWEFKNAYEVHTGINFTREGVREPFAITDDVLIPADTYDHVETQLVFMTDQSDWLAFTVRSNLGGFFGGSRVSVSPSLKVRQGETISTEFSLSYNEIRLPVGDFTTNLFRARVTYSLSTRIFLQMLAQYNDQSNLWSANARFGWLRTANTGLFIVFNQTNQLDGWPGEAVNRGLTIKYTHLFDIFE